LVFIVKRWFGVNGLGDFGSFMESTFRGQLFTIASASHINVVRASSFNCIPFISRIADKKIAN
jgi:hypothetical protein